MQPTSLTPRLSLAKAPTKLGNGVWERHRYEQPEQVTELKLGNSPTAGSLWQLNYFHGGFTTGGNVDLTKICGNIAKQTMDFAGSYQPVCPDLQIRCVIGSRKRGDKRKCSDLDADVWLRPVCGHPSRKMSADNPLEINHLTLPQIDANTNRFSVGRTIRMMRPVIWSESGGTRVCFQWR